MRLEISLIVVVGVLIVYAIATRNEYLTIEASDGITYTMLEDYSDANSAAESLAVVNRQALTLLEHLKKVVSEGRTTERTSGIIRRLLANYDFEKIYETRPTGRNGTSFTVEKGMELHLCTREKDSLRLHNTHDLMFVMIHEMAHMANPTWGHEKDFWEVFKYLLYEADVAGIHHPVDYKKQPLVYCGLLVNYNPFFDPTCIGAHEDRLV